MFTEQEKNFIILCIERQMKKSKEYTILNTKVELEGYQVLKALAESIKSKLQ